MQPVLSGMENAVIDIACVSIAYKNGEMIKLLTERGTLIATGKLHKVPEVDKKINMLYFSKNL